MTTETTWTRAELSQLVEEYQKLRDWTIIRDFCVQAYGENKVATMEIETYGEYNDEGGTDYRIDALYARNASGEKVVFDFSLPFWQQVLEDQETSLGELEEDALYHLREWYNKKPTEPSLWVTWEELPYDIHEGGTDSYDLTQPPTVSFAIIRWNKVIC
jgi:hypothetical protein